MSACFTPFWVSSRAQQGNPHVLKARLLRKRKYDLAETAPRLSFRTQSGEESRFCGGEVASLNEHKRLAVVRALG
jgi:hypothetical protein